MRTIFRAIDLNSSGYIPSQQFIHKLKEVDRGNIINQGELQRFVSNFQEAGGQVNYENFIRKMDFEVQKQQVIKKVFVNAKQDLVSNGQQ